VRISLTRVHDIKRRRSSTGLARRKLGFGPFRAGGALVSILKDPFDPAEFQVFFLLN